jgi:hypothetical protein
MDADDFDWAMGELLHLFDDAARRGVLPHLLNPAIFQPAWSVLNSQPFEVRQKAHRILMWHYKPSRASEIGVKRAKRYIYAAPSSVLIAGSKS